MDKATEGNDGIGSDLWMSPEQMLTLARQTAELVVQRIENLPGQGAWAGEFRRDLEDQLMKPPPEESRSASQVIEEAAHEIVPAALSLDHPRCFGFIPSQPTWPGVLADFMVAGFNINQSSWLISSGPSQLELVVVDWFRRWIGYSENAGGVLTSGGSAANLDGLVAAREAAGNPERGTLYMSDQGHSALIKAARIIGLRPECIRMIPTDGRFRMDMDALAEKVADDRAAGFSPIAVCANAGTSSCGAVDPLEAMADYCEAQNIWLHVDAAHGGFAIVTEEGRNIMRGIERADSIVLDAHKWFFQPYEVGGLMVKDLSTLERVFVGKCDILQDTIWGAGHPNFSDRGLQLSRSVRALKIWMSVQTFGMAAFRNAQLHGMELAHRIEKYVEESIVLEMLASVALGIACFRINPENAELDKDMLETINKTVLARVFWEDHAFISSTRLDGKLALRMCVINYTTTWNEVRETLEAISKFGMESLVQDAPPD
ncbi:MAG: aminotransferase class I/II-fold pyridoxal phosphate-dependent enzyme [Rhodothermaceae bacterium]|nr:aminotransferase class I/II-fold pyridoxal phosphate-dependent enzyme [Rhodothermaceae bacterium]MXW33253.1 aminotransferase class I/II-fold pyridoxal phosphate-dependent enzyme [Rhodothermaceae bacterium]MXZ17919.1 aminotransferase class I/II-fold pyridoxal phosphate-dependent enzyme [Rhodothermaceae bacterium]MYC04779.1 aminotransferase class I/II-fold pyridoxal phosphate-dependent enzyme [Rhodothermaceae bacterium]MYE62275.1 aminotransferase class I/II-fold pyridoxal phosphate-dependent e